MNRFDVQDTIVAIASAPGHSPRGIIRISGPQCLQCLEKVFPRLGLKTDARSRYQAHAFDVAMDLGDEIRLPGALLLWPTRRSYTRQPSAEFHTLGSPPLLDSAIRHFGDAGARLAQPGEFTLRAFLSGRLDLTQAEAVLAVIDADSSTQLSDALTQLAGGLSGPIVNVRDRLMHVLAELEAGLDFVEEDIEFIDRSELVRQLTRCQLTIEEVIDQISDRDTRTQQIRVALVGFPNAGKSSLFNCLLGADQAIVTSVPGTTTDYLNATTNIGGADFELIDTAGWEFDRTSDSIAGQAQQQARRSESDADLVLVCLDGTRQLDRQTREQLLKTNSSLIVVTKSDLVDSTRQQELIEQLNGMPLQSSIVVWTSSMTKTGLPELKERLFAAAVDRIERDHDVIGATTLRASSSLRESNQAVAAAREAAEQGLGEEVVAAEIRRALEELATVVGTVYTDDILDIVFSRFCIGK